MRLALLLLAVITVSTIQPSIAANDSSAYASGLHLSFVASTNLHMLPALANYSGSVTEPTDHAYWYENPNKVGNRLILTGSCMLIVGTAMILGGILYNVNHHNTDQAVTAITLIGAGLDVIGGGTTAAGIVVKMKYREYHQTL